MNKIEIVRGQQSININWLINGCFNMSMTRDAFAGLVGQLTEFMDSDDPYMIAYQDVEDDDVDDMASLHDVGGEA